MLFFFFLIGLLTQLRGEFEERFKSVLRDVERADGMIMLFIDEIHMIVGAGASDGNSFDAGNFVLT